MSRKKEDPGGDEGGIKKPADRLSGLLASDLLGKIKKKYGSDILMRASDFSVQQRPRIPTGVFPLDYGLGGGIPVGCFSQIYGEKSSGKTTTVLRIFKSAQNMCSFCYRYLEDAPWGCKCKNPRQYICVYFDIEGALDLPWVRSIGVDTSKMVISVPEYAEQALDTMEALIRSGEVDLIAIDSIAMLTPSKEIEESVEKDMMGVGARLVTKAFRKMQAAINAVGQETDRRPTIVGINQIRMQLGVMFGNPETTPGGKVVGFTAATETRCAAGKYEMDEASGKPTRVQMRFKINKNKTAGAKMEGEYYLHLMDSERKKKGEVEDEEYMITMGEKTGLVQRSKGYECLGAEFRTKKDLEDRLMTDRNFKMQLYYALMHVLLESEAPTLPVAT